MIQEGKVSEIREQYEPGEINVVRVETPRSRTHIHSPNTVKDIWRAQRENNGYIQAMPLEDVIWEVDLDEKIEWLTGNQGSTRLLAKNVYCHYEVLEDDE